MKNMRNEEAVSPVIGVILMVVITVIIAAVMAVFAFGIGEPTKAPQAQLRFVADSGNLTITNTGGDSLILKDERISAMYAANLTNMTITAQTMQNWTDPNGAGYLAPGTTVSGNWSGDKTLETGGIIIIQVLDVPTGQMIANTRVTVR